MIIIALRPSLSVFFYEILHAFTVCQTKRNVRGEGLADGRSTTDPVFSGRTQPSRNPLTILVLVIGIIFSPFEVEMVPIHKNITHQWVPKGLNTQRAQSILRNDCNV